MKQNVVKVDLGAQMSNGDPLILELALRKLSKAFDEFISECTENGKPKQPSMQALMKAKGYLPQYCENAFRKKK